MTKMMENSLKLTITLFKPVFESSLDGVCVLDTDCRIKYANAQLRSLLGLSGRQVTRAPVFCECITLAACTPKCLISKIFDSGKKLRLDETPAERGDSKIRVSLNAVPVFYPGKQKGSKPLGIIISARETTGEILLQAKYHRTMLMLQERDREVLELAERLRDKEEALRRARG